MDKGEEEEGGTTTTTGVVRFAGTGTFGGGVVVGSSSVGFFV